MKTTNVEVIQRISVEYDETKFTQEFLDSFPESFFPFDTIDEHIEYLADGYARGFWDEFSFIEGYGQAKEWGFKFELYDAETNIE